MSGFRFFSYGNEPHHRGINGYERTNQEKMLVAELKKFQQVLCIIMYICNYWAAKRVVFWLKIGLPGAYFPVIN